MHTLYIGNDMRLAFYDRGQLKDINNYEITGATITVSVYQNDGQTEVGGVSWPLTFSEDGEGEYHVILPASMEIEAGNYYIIQINVDTGASKSMWRKRVQARFRD